VFNGICHWKGLRKRIPVWIHLLDVIGVGKSFLPSLKISPSPFSNLEHLNDGGSSDTAGSLTFRVRRSLRHLETSCCRSKLKFRNESRDVKKVTLFSAALFLAMSSLFFALALTIRSHLLRRLPADPEFKEKEIYDKSSQGGKGINLQRFRLPLCSCQFNDRLLLGLKGPMSEARAPCAKGSFAWRHSEQSPARQIEDSVAGGPRL
jgi:hypothetical protein